MNENAITTFVSLHARRAPGESLGCGCDKSSSHIYENIGRRNGLTSCVGGRTVVVVVDNGKDGGNEPECPEENL